MALQEREVERANGVMRFVQLLLETFEALACESAKISPPTDMLPVVQDTLACVRASSSHCHSG